MLRNLLANAVKFTDTGGVTLQVGRAGGLLAFAVRDTGIGIPAGKLEMIFEAFQQADGTTSRKYGGTGLGLSISKELARMLGGRIEVTSTVGEGSVFTLLRARRAAAAGSAGSRAAPRAGPVDRAGPLSGPTPLRGPALRAAPAVPGLAGATVLIVDDDVRNVFALTSALELHGLTVLYADNGAAGIRLLTEHPEVDVVLMDTMMPDLDGNETTRRIRELPGGRELPVVFLTAKAMPGDREASLAAGATEYVTKPVDLDELLALMANWVTPPAPPPPGGPMTGRPRVLAVDDRRENLLALQAILEGLAVEVVSVTSGEDALKRLLTEDYAVILLDAHMPGMDGFETAGHIKQRERTRHIPVLFLTAVDYDPHLAFRGYQAGAVDYITKPFDPWVLRSKVGVFVDLWSVHARLAEQAEECARLRTAIDDAVEQLEDGAIDEARDRLKAARDG